MKYKSIILFCSVLFGCTESEKSTTISVPEKSRDCIQAENRLKIYSIGLEELKSLYSKELDTSEAQRRISAMQGRIDLAKESIVSHCEKNDGI